MRLNPLACLVALIILTILFLPLGRARALTLSDRSVRVSTATPSATAMHTFQFTYASTSAIGSVVFEYCDNSPIFTYTCDAPPGLDVSSATVLSQSGNIGFSFDGADSTVNKIVISRPAVPAVAVASSYSFGNITNPSTAGQSEFIRISTYASTDGSGPLTDNGAVAFATTSPFNIGADVPTFLRLCVAITVAPDCSSFSGDHLNLGTLTPAAARAGVSQFAVGTNSLTGYVTYVLGTTMTSGNNTIAALASPTPSFPGNSQFGINLRNNAIPNVGADPFGAGTGTPTANYNTPNLFMYSSGDAIVISSQPSDYNRLTVSYMVNVSAAQAPGVYSSTYTYLTTANF